jgi:hypothetical protein
MDPFVSTLVKQAAVLGLAVGDPNLIAPALGVASR